MIFKNEDDFSDWYHYHRNTMVLYDGTDPVLISGYHSWNDEGYPTLHVRSISERGTREGQRIVDARKLEVAVPLCAFVNTRRGGVARVSRSDRRQWQKGMSGDNVSISENLRGVVDVVNNYNVPGRGEWYDVMARAMTAKPVSYTEAVKSLSRNNFARAFGDSTYVVYSPTKPDIIEVVTKFSNVVATAPITSPEKVTIVNKHFADYMKKWMD